MYFIGILRGAAMARFISVAWPHCSRLLLLHQTALTAKRAEAARAVTPILAPQRPQRRTPFFLQCKATRLADAVEKGLVIFGEQ